MGGLLLALAAPRAAFAWGCQGHQIVAYIALEHLRPPVAARVEQILAASPAPAPAIGRRERPNPLCLLLGAPLIVQVAAWADAVRTPATGPLHYIDLPIGNRGRELNFHQVCQAGCVTEAIEMYRRRLTTASDPEQKAEALRYLIHLVGDVSQPLHDSDDDDRGGNCVPTRVPGRRERTNLHADWDWVFLSQDEGTRTNAAFAHEINQDWGSRLPTPKLNPEAWARQGYEVALRSVFDPLRLSPGCRRRPVKLSAAYVRDIRPVVERQLELGGLRLAKLLNDTLLIGAGPRAATEPRCDHMRSARRAARLPLPDAMGGLRAPELLQAGDLSRLTVEVLGDRVGT